MSSGLCAVSVNHDAKIQHRKSSFWAWVGFVAKKLGKSAFGRFRWVSAFIIYIKYILYLYADSPAFELLLICNMQNYHSAPPGGGRHTLYIYINKVFFSLYIYAREKGEGGCGFEFCILQINKSWMILVVM